MVDSDLPRLSHPHDYLRYGRQMILDGFGLEGTPRPGSLQLLLVIQTTQQVN
jgi:molybdopterin/thiamine biosynthesis adenylyltransferase